jgi:hypothetical protein
VGEEKERPAAKQLGEESRRIEAAGWLVPGEVSEDAPRLELIDPPAHFGRDYGTRVRHGSSAQVITSEVILQGAAEIISCR